MLRLQRGLSRSLDAASTLCLWLAALCIVAITALMLVQAASRSFGIQSVSALGVSVQIRGIDDIVGWLVAGATTLAMAAMFRRGDLVRVSLLQDYAGERARRPLELLCLGFAVAFIGYTAVAFAHFVRESWTVNDMNQGLIKIPLWIPQLPMVIGIAVLWCALVEDFIRVLARQKPSYQQAMEEKAARHDFTESV